MRTVWAAPLRVLGASLALISCIPMLAMLPAGVIAVLTLIGLTATPIVAWAAPLAPIAPHFFILSIIVLTIGHLRCGWQPASIALIGGLLIYLSMYVVAIPAAVGLGMTQTPMAVTVEAMLGMPTAASSTAMNGMTPATPAAAAPPMMPGMIGRTNAPLFYAGALLLAGSFGLVWLRRRANICHPFNPFSLVRGASPTHRN